MGYIDELGSLVGGRPLIMAGAAVLILNRRGHLLMMKRTDNGCWGIPGGAMEPGESLEETAIREAGEELGIDIRQMDLFGVFSG
jgi:8-oxo-dGTP pyrophosphatase MutT (NUDIX family)